MEICGNKPYPGSFSTGISCQLEKGHKGKHVHKREQLHPPSKEKITWPNREDKRDGV